MSEKLRYYEEMSVQTARQIAAGYDEWRSFLDTSARLYKYGYEDQLLIHAQRPDATACASYELWNERMRRYVKRGTTGIALIDRSGDKPKLNYVFDVSDTGTRRNSRTPQTWTMDEQSQSVVSEMLRQRYDASDLPGFPVQLYTIAAAQADAYWQEHRQDVLDIIDGSFLSEYDVDTIGVRFRNAAQASIAYTLMERCGLDAKQHLTNEDFTPMLEFNTPRAIGVLGGAVSDISGDILRQIERTVKAFKRERSSEHDRNELQTERRLPDSRPDNEGVQTFEQVRQDAPGLSESPSPGDLERAGDVGRAAQPSGGDRGESERTGGAGDGAAGGEKRRERGDEEAESAGLGAGDERAESPGRGAGDPGDDSRVTAQPDATQMSLFATEAEQIEMIDTAKDAERAPFAFSLPQEVIDEILRSGSNEDFGRVNIVLDFQKEKSLDAVVQHLQKVYVGGTGMEIGGTPYSAWFDEAGIHIARGNQARYSNLAQTVAWEDAAKRIAEMMDAGQYATELEIIEASTYELSVVAERILYMHREITDRDAGFLPSMAELPKGGFPQEKDWMIQHLADTTFRARLSAEMEVFRDAFAENSDLLRFKMYKPQAMLDALSELNLSRKEYASELMTAPKPERFITEDEIDAALSAGSNMAGGKGRIYRFFSDTHTPKEQEDFLKNEYGIGGRNNALPGSFRSDIWYDGKGIGLKKRDCPDVQLSWPKVARRIQNLIRKDRFLTPEEKREFERIETEKRLAEEAETIRITDDELPTKPDETVDNSVENPVETAVDNSSDVQTSSENSVGSEERDDAVEDIAAEDEQPESEQPEYHYQVRDTVYLDGNPFTIESIDRLSGYVTLHDDTARYPISRVENIVAFEKMLGRDERNKKYLKPPEEHPQPEIHYAVGNTVYLEDHVFEIIDIANGSVYARSVDANIIRAEFQADFERLLTEDARNARYFSGAPDISAPVTLPENPQPIPSGRNFHITDDHLGEGGAKTKYGYNVAAIRTLKQIEAEGRGATEAEQEILSRYVGWGGLPNAFDESKDDWSKEYAELKELLTPEEYDMARASTLNAHYTSPTVIRAIYDVVEQMGFKSGNVLEPSCGVGNFFGMMPESMQASRLYGVELDSITGRIAKQLYPQAHIEVKGFEKTDRQNFFDLAVGNVPFGSYKLNDKKFNAQNFLIHDYFFAKTLDQVRAGGVIAFITSKGTMDKASPEVRRYIAERAELLGAIRLPNNAFARNAGTEVTSDIIFLKKRDRAVTIEEPWIHLGRTADGIPINAYFAEHPEMVLGRMEWDKSMYGDEKETSCHPIEGADLAQQLAEAITHIDGRYEEAELPDLTDGEEITETIPADPDVKNYSYTVVDGQVYFRQDSVMTRPDLNQTAQERVKGMVELRDCVRSLMDAQLSDASDEEIHALQAELNTRYDAFTAKYGLINARANKQAFADDSSYYLLCSLENINEKGELESKADMFTKRTIRQRRVIDHADTAVEALAISIGEKAGVDLPYMAKLTGKTEQELIDDLRGVIFQVPLKSGPNGEDIYVTADEYLSGNVRDKLRVAKLAAADLDPAFQLNVEALQKAMPKELDASEIDIRLGATWVHPDYIKEFTMNLFDLPFYLARAVKVQYSEHTSEWRVEGKSVGANNVAVNMTYGTDRVNGLKILEDTLNLRDVRVYDTVEELDGSTKRVLNQKETTLAQQKQQAIKDAFRDWIWKDPQRRHSLVERYNALFNSTRPREYDGSHIIFDGMNPEISLREHQRNAIAHVLYGGNTLLAHEVGAGKTYEMAASAMESKRLGLCHKSMFVVPNHLTEQWASEFLRLYPSANLLVTTKKDFEKANRKKFCARVATGDYDAIIIGHSQFERIPLSAERQQQIIRDQIAEITEGIEEIKVQRGERFTIKQLEKTKKSLEARLEKLLAEGKKDDVVTFEELGVDRLFVDEAHTYKNLFLYTKMRNVAGLSTSEAQKSSDMFAKCQYLDEITGGKGVIFATGTPVSNSMTELYTMQRYLQYGTLMRLGLTHFDSWASTFGETSTAIELAPEGTGYRARTRFAKFFNLPELMNLFKEIADIKTSDQLNLPVPEAKFETIVAQPSEIQQEMVESLSERAAAVHSGAVDPTQDNMLSITSDGRKIGLDQRLMNPLLPDDPTSKLNLCVDNVMRIWEEGKEQCLTQLLFCDMSIPKGDGTFNVYDDIRTKLIAKGVPADEIAFIHSADTEVKKKELFAKVRSGQVRVLLGSTAKMGAGTNVQRLLVAVHHLDVGWRPADMTQRNGRIIRQGNLNKHVHVYNYVTNGTFDAYLFQTLETKQRFISQIMSSKSPVRACEDVDETALSYAEIKALCAGDERIREKMDLDVDVARLRLLKANYQSNLYRLEDRLMKSFPEEIRTQEAYIAGFHADMKMLEDHPLPADKEQFVGMELYGKQYTDKEKAGAMLLEAAKAAPHGNEEMTIGSYRGFRMSLRYDSFRNEYLLTLRGNMAHTIGLGQDARGNLVRIENGLNSIQNRLTDAQNKLGNLQRQMETAKEEIGKPFPQEEELRQKSARLAELDAALNMDKRSKVKEEKKEKPERASVLAALKSHTPAAAGRPIRQDRDYEVR